VITDYLFSTSAELLFQLQQKPQEILHASSSKNRLAFFHRGRLLLDFNCSPEWLDILAREKSPVNCFIAIFYSYYAAISFKVCESNQLRLVLLQKLDEKRMKFLFAGPAELELPTL